MSGVFPDWLEESTTTIYTEIEGVVLSDDMEIDVVIEDDLSTSLDDNITVEIANEDLTVEVD